MIYAYAIDPDAMTEWIIAKNARHLRGKFGPGTPRVILDYPKTWRTRVHNLIAGSDVRRQKLVEEMLIGRLFGTKRIKWRGTNPYDDDETWLKNACEVLLPATVEAIIATQNPTQNAKVLLESAIEAEKNTLWDKPNGQTIEKSATAITQALAPVLRHANEIHFVDPNFNHTSEKGAQKRRFMRTLDECLRVLEQRPNYPERVVIHTDDRMDLTQFNAATQNWAKDFNVCVRVHFRRWGRQAFDNKDLLHNRYLLTDLGGITVQFGFDARDQRDQTSTDDLNIMSNAPDSGLNGSTQYQQRWRDWVHPATTFEPELPHPDPMVGTRGI